LDEIGEVRESELAEIVYVLMAMENRTTERLTSRAGIPFKLLFPSTGERTLADIMATATGKTVKGCQEAPLAEIPACAGAGFGVFKTFTSIRCLTNSLGRFILPEVFEDEIYDP
jgi:hypothetical protein